MLEREKLILKCPKTSPNTGQLMFSAELSRAAFDNRNTSQAQALFSPTPMESAGWWWHWQPPLPPQRRSALQEEAGRLPGNAQGHGNENTRRCYHSTPVSQRVQHTFLSFSEPSVRRIPLACMWRYRIFCRADMSHLITYSTWGQSRIQISTRRKGAVGRWPWRRDRWDQS